MTGKDPIKEWCGIGPQRCRPLGVPLVAANTVEMSTRHLVVS